VFLPPVLYVYSIQGLENYLENRWTSHFKAALISDPAKLLNGTMRIENEIQDNIHQFMKKNRFIKLGADAQIMVRTKTGELLYPSSNGGLFSEDSGLLGDWIKSDDRDRIAANNVRIMRQGIQCSISVIIRGNTWLANGILVFYVFCFAGVLFANYRRREKRLDQAIQLREKELESARSKLEAAQSQAQELFDREQYYQREIDKLSSELSITSDKLQKTEDQALEEIEILEEQLRKSMSDRQKKEEEVHSLVQEIEHLKSDGWPLSKKKAKGYDWMIKRFNMLYKNLEFSERSVEGFLRLSQEMQLRAEVVFQYLDQSSDHVKVKRKITIGKNVPAVFESEFADDGRIYWRKGASSKAAIVLVGTKNTQKRDLDFLAIN
jgi:hypothetical protein